MKKPSSSPLLLFASSPFLLLLSLALILLLTACGPAAQGDTTPNTALEPTTLAESTPVESLPTDTVLPTDALPAPTDAPVEATALPTESPSVLPTDTPLALPTEAVSQLQIALVNAATDLLLWQETGPTLTPLVPAAGAIDARLSDDGTMIAYRKDIDYGEQELWVVNTDGSNNRLLLSVDALAGLDPDALGVLMYLYEWIPNTHTLAFNTVEYVEAPGLFLNDDLHFFDVDFNELTTQLTAGTGGNFVFSPDGKQYALIRQNFDTGFNTISLLNTDGTNIRNDVLTYPYVLTYSEANYYAQPVWAADSASLRVAIPPQDALGEPGSFTILWDIPTDGSPAVQLHEVVTQPLAGVQFSPDLSRIAYTRLPNPDDYTTTELVLARADGSDETVFATGNFFFLTWAPDSIHFVYVNNDLQATFLGDTDGNSTALTSFPTVWNITWIDATRFLFTTQTDTGQQLHLATLGADSTVLLEQPDSAPFYDFDN